MTAFQLIACTLLAACPLSATQNHTSDGTTSDKSAKPAGVQVEMARPNPLMTGIWHPTVGRGGLYEVTRTGGRKSQIEITIVGKEDVNGDPGYWFELYQEDAKVYYKDLIVAVPEGLAFAKRVMQPRGEDPVEFDSSMHPGERRTTPADIREEADLVGTETISVPAGTFICEHYRLKGGWGDAWLSDKVSPWGLVKMLVASPQGVPEYYTDGRPPKNLGPTRDKDTSMVLIKVVTDAKDHITSTPQNVQPIKH